MADDKETWRKEIKKDKSFIEGVKNSGEHLHYNSDKGSDIPVNWRNEKTGEGKNLRETPLNKLKKD